MIFITPGPSYRAERIGVVRGHYFEFFFGFGKFPLKFLYSPFQLGSLVLPVSDLVGRKLGPVFRLLVFRLPIVPAFSESFASLDTGLL